MYQSITIVGNVGRDPELSYTPQGVAVCKFTVAVNKVTGRGETRKEKTTWFRVSVWRERAETANQYVRKGMKILVVGEVDVNAYTDRNGQPAATLELTANNFQFLSGRSEEGDEGNYQQSSRAPSGGDAEGADEIPF